MEVVFNIAFLVVGTRLNSRGMWKLQYHFLYLIVKVKACVSATIITESIDFTNKDFWSVVYT